MTDIPLYHKVRGSADGGFEVLFEVRDGKGRLWLPGCTDCAVVPEGHGVVVEFDAVSVTQSVPLRLQVRRVARRGPA